MTIEAKPVVKNKYWIVEKDGRKIATIQAADDGVVLVQGTSRSKYPSIKALSSKYNIRFVPAHRRNKNTEESVYDYPCAGKPYNAVYDLRLRLPLYTTTNKSKSYYCAGYYLVQYGDSWAKEFCPKKIILTRNPFRGPFKNEQEVVDNLKSLTTYK